MRSFLLVILCIFLSLNANAAIEQETIIGLGGNAYVTQRGQNKTIKITDNGIEHWTDKEDVVSIYFYLEEPQVLNVLLNGAGTSTIKVSSGNKSYKVKLKSDNLSAVSVGKFDIKQAGYVRFDLQGLDKAGASFGNIKELILKDLKGKATYVHDFSNYWGRRGPSVHMKYTLPKDTIEWFYNEITVPKEGEVIGSYYMANGFGEGYCGIQHNSSTEKRILFSVWSPFQTDDPNAIPEEDQIKMLRRGEGVHIGEFGNEGSGGQSYLRYNWTPGVTYKFLTHVRPDGNGNTVYTAYFYAADETRWRLIASFLRPKTNTWYRGAHSFLENFSPNQGYLSRCVEFANQWALSKDGKWHELTEATFTYDATAGAGVRLDYQGGVLDTNNFYLKNGGFFNENTQYKTIFHRNPTNKEPVVDFDRLKNLESN